MDIKVCRQLEDLILKNVIIIAAICVFFCAGLHAGQATRIELTDKVLVKDTIRFGINLGSDTYYSGAVLLKKRSQQNFEGTIYRQCHFGPSQDEHGATSWFRQPQWWQDLMVKHGYYEILSGPAKGIRGKIKAISTKKEMHNGKPEDFMYIEFDKQVPPGPPNGGLLVEAFMLKDGQFRSLDGFWTSKQNRIEIGDVPAGSFGCAALNMRGSQGKAHYHLSTHYHRFGELNGRWHVRFQAKIKSGEPSLAVMPSPERWGEKKTVKLESQWKQFDEIIDVNRVPEPNNDGDVQNLFFKIEVAGGDVLIDDIELWMEGDRNPTVFRDDLIAVLKKFKPGVIRYLQTGGSTIDNTIAPPLRSYSYSNRQAATYGPYEEHQTDPYSLHEMYELCKYVGAEPWYCLPGTLHKEELAHFIEYLGAPADVGYGKVRAEMGQQRPWSEVFDHIHIEFGNEAWNNAAWYQCGGYNGPDYWRELIETGKKSPYYKPNMLFHTAGQAAWSGRNAGILKNAPNADRFAVAPYLISELNNKDLEILDTDEKLFRWVFAKPIWRSLDPRGAMYQNYGLAKAASIELSIYEVNHHTTHGDAPAGPRNKIVTSIAGGINVANDMLLMMREHKLRTQCLFSLIQQKYRAAGVGDVYLWGTALNMRKGHERYRPTFLACMLANKVIGGNMVETIHSKNEPTFDAAGYFAYQGGAETVRNIPVIWSYGFAEGGRRGLILISLDVSEARPVEIAFAGRAEQNKASLWRMSAEKITANNEFEVKEPQVTVVQETLNDFGPNYKMILPPHSMTVLEWEMQ
jgi:alpha-L-arabinofuranosidase